MLEKSGSKENMGPDLVGALGLREPIEQIIPMTDPWDDGIFTVT